MGTWLVGLLLMVWGCTETWWASIGSRPKPIGVSELIDALWWLPSEGGHVDIEWPEEDDVEDIGPIQADKLDSAGWVALGFSPRRAASAIRYRNAVGGFRDQNTLERMRVLPKGWLERHAHRLVFSETTAVLNEKPVEKRGTPLEVVRFEGAEKTWKESLAPVDLNSADSLTLVAIHGVGPWVTGRILDARRKWGGFSDTALLVDALGWDSLARALMPLFVCESPLIHLHCPDSMTVEGWCNLPGIGPGDAMGIVRYVEHHGGSGDALMQCKILDSVQWARLIPYLDCEVGNNP